MFFNRQLEMDEDAINLDTDSTSSRSVSLDFNSPAMNGETVLDLLYTPSMKEDTLENTQKRQSKRSKLKELFRSLSWRNKNKSDMSKENKTVENADDDVDDCSNDDAHIDINKDQFSLSNSPRRGSPEYNFDNLYDNTKPLLYIDGNNNCDEHTDTFGSLTKSETSSQLEFTVPPNSSATIESQTPLATPSPEKDKSSNGSVHSRSPIRSLSRKFSIFSIRSRPQTATNTIDLSHVASYFTDDTLLTDWRITEVEKTTLETQPCPKIRDTKNVSKSDNKIYLFLDPTANKGQTYEKSKEIEDLENENIEKLLYYPYAKEQVQKYYLQKGNYLSKPNKNEGKSGTEKNNKEDENKVSKPEESSKKDIKETELTVESTQKEHEEEIIKGTNIYEKENFWDNNYNFDNEYGKHGRKLNHFSVKSLRLQESIEFYQKEIIPTLRNSEKDYFSKDTDNEEEEEDDPIMRFNKHLLRFDFDSFWKINTNENHIEPFKKWNMWLDVIDKSNSAHKKFSVFTTITTYSKMSTLQDNYDSLLEYYVQEKQQQLYLLKQGVPPIFHGKYRVKTYIEYVYIIPFYEGKNVWKSILELLITEKLNSTSVGYEIVGVCWRGYTFKNETGYQLTLYVNMQSKFNYEYDNIFLSDIKTLVPYNITHCFKKCRTFSPQDRKVHIIDVL